MFGFHHMLAHEYVHALAALNFALRSDCLLFDLLQDVFGFILAYVSENAVEFRIFYLDLHLI